jgi:colicin import membrane protein
MTEQLVNYNITDAAIGEMREQYMRLRIVDLDDKDGAKAVSAARRAVKAKRCEVERLRKELKADALEWGRKVDSEAKRITEQLAPIEKHLEDEEARIENERARIAAEEEERRRAAEKAKMEHTLARVQALAQFGGYQGLMTPFQIGQLSEMEFDELLDEYRTRWEVAESERKAEEHRLEQIRREQEAERERIAEERRVIEEEKRRLAEEKAAREAAERKAEQERRAKFQADLDDIARQGEEIKAAMPPDFGPFVEIATSCDTYLQAIERAATIKALRWVRSMIEGGIAYVTLVHWIDDAITRLENGGEL